MPQTKIQEQQDLQALFDLLPNDSFVLPLDVCQAFLEKHPNMSEGYFILGIQAFLSGFMGEAMDVIEKAHAIDPGVREYVEALSCIYSLAGRLNDALYYAKIITVTEPHLVISALLPPNLKNFVESAGQVQPHQHFISASLAFNRRDFMLAIEECKSQLKMTPMYVPALELYGKTLVEVGDYGLAIMTVQDAVVLAPDDNANLYLILADACCHVGYFEKAEQHIEKAVLIDSKSVDVGAKAYRILAKLPKSKDRVRTAWQDFKARCFPSHEPYFEYTLPTEGKIHIGFISDKFYDCFEGRMLSELISKVDTKIFKTFAYIQNINKDQLTQSFINSIKDSRDIYDINDKTLALIMQRDGIDVLIDMCGLGDGQRLAFMARNPSGLRMSWLAEPHGGGQPGIQYVFTDNSTNDGQAQLLDKDQETFPLQSPLFTALPVIGYGDIAPLPALENGYITFGARLDFYNFVHHGPFLQRILASVPGSKLIILVGSGFSDFTLNRLNEIFEPLGLLDSIELYTVDDDERMGGYFDHIDLYLPSVFEDVNRLVEALWMGVPSLLKTDVDVACLPHVGVVLDGIGAETWVSNQDERLCDVAKAFAENLETLATCRGDLRNQVEQSAFMNINDFGMDFQTKLADLFFKNASKINHALKKDDQ